MPGKVKVKILAGRNLPVMDRSSDTTDAYVEIKLGNTTYKTDVCRKSLNPQWNSEWYRYEVDDSELQDEPLQIRLMDHDTYSANDAIGKVYLDLNPLLLPASPPVKNAWGADNTVSSGGSSAGGAVMSGWIPVFDTMHGIRGEVNIIVKVELFSDFNKFRQSSCGVQFFCAPAIPQGYHAQVIHGFVEELVVNDDPEYQWIDKIRTPRASNEARQTLFFKLSGELQRKIGLKALDLGGNAVIGYHQCFDLEGESGIVVRGIGTAVTLTRLQEVSIPAQLPLETSVADESMQTALVVDDSSLVICDSSGMLEPLKLSVAPPSPKLCVTPPTPRLASPASPPPTSKTAELQKSGLLPVKMGLKFPGVAKWKQKRKNPKQSVMVLPHYMASDAIIQEQQYGFNSHPERHFSHSAPIDVSQKPFIYNRKGDWSTQSLISDMHDEGCLKHLLHQEDMRSEAERGNKITRGLRAIRLFPQNKLSKRLHALKAKLQTDTPMSEEDGSELDNSYSSISEASRRKNGASEAKKSKTNLRKHHGRSNSESIASTVIRSLMENSGLDKVLEVKESPGSSPASPSKRDNSGGKISTNTPENIKITVSESYLRLPPSDEGPELRYVDGHLISNTSSNVSSTSESSSSEEDASEDYSLDLLVKENSPCSSTAEATKPSKTNSSNNDKDAFVDTPIVTSTPSNPETTRVFYFGKSLSDANQKVETPTVGNNESTTDVPFNCETVENAEVADSDPIPISQSCANAEECYPKSVAERSESSQATDVVVRFASKSLSPHHEPLSHLSLIHKSVSAATLCVNPSAHKHDSNDEQASLCHENIKHGPCFVPPSRQPQLQQTFTSVEEEKQHLAGSPPQQQSSKVSPSPAKLSTTAVGIHRRSSDSDLSITPKGNSLTGSDRSSMGGHLRQTPAMVRPTMNQESLDMLEYPFLTMSKYPPGFILHLGGTVSSRSVKLLERITNLEEPETRDAWWTEIRMEVRSHARALGCNVVLGYSENTSICDDVCVLSASGTAAVINLQFNAMNTSSDQDSSIQHVISRVHLHNKELMTTSLDRTDFERDKSTPQKGETALPFVAGTKVRHPSDGCYEIEPASPCSLCHIPYSETSVPFRVTMLKCALCRRGKVPEVLFTTVELPEGVATTGKGCFLQAYVCRAKRDCKGELNAKEISDGLPFLEYELHRLLINKLKVKGMNSIFGLKVQVSIGERMLVGLATGTAVFLTALPIPPVPKVSGGNSWADDKKLAEIQKLLQDTVKKNRELYQLKPLIDPECQPNGKASDTEESEDELSELDLASGNKDTCVLEVDDAEDVDVISLLIDPRPPEGFHVVNTEVVPGLDELEIVRNLQMFTQVWRAKVPLGQPTSVFGKHFHRLLQFPLLVIVNQLVVTNFSALQIKAILILLLQSVYFKLRRLVPCALCNLQFRVELPEPDEMQITVLGMALGLGETDKHNKFKRKSIAPSSSKEAIKKTDDDLIFNLDEDHSVPENAALNSQHRPRNRSPLRNKVLQPKLHHTPPRERYGVDMTPLSYIPGGKIERYLGNLNFFFIRESTCIREGGGLSGFMHSFVTEVLAIVRAHVTALGGNAMVAYFMSECVLYHNPHKNQGQCLINVGGDVVYVTYYPEE